MTTETKEIIADTSKAKVEHPAWKALMAEFSLDIKKTFMGREGHGFNAILNWKGKKVAEVHDMADGGMYNFYWSSPRSEAETRFTELVNALPKTESQYFKDGFNYDNDSAVAFLAEVDELLKRIKRARTPKVIVSNGKETFEYRYKLDGTLRQHIMAKYPDALIWNDLL